MCAGLWATRYDHWQALPEFSEPRAAVETLAGAPIWLGPPEAAWG